MYEILAFKLSTITSYQLISWSCEILQEKGVKTIILH